MCAIATQPANMLHVPPVPHVFASLSASANCSRGSDPPGLQHRHACLLLMAIARSQHDKHRWSDRTTFQTTGILLKFDASTTTRVEACAPTAANSTSWNRFGTHGWLTASPCASCRSLKAMRHCTKWCNSMPSASARSLAMPILFSSARASFCRQHECLCNHVFGPQPGIQTLWHCPLHLVVN